MMGYVWAALGVCKAVVVAGMAVSDGIKRYGHNKRTKKAKKLYKHVLKQGKENINNSYLYLYLRPFKEDIEHSYDNYCSELERDLEKATRRHGIFVALKGAKKNIGHDVFNILDSLQKFPFISFGPTGGASKIKAGNNEWKHNITLLIKKAKKIFLVPSTSKGTFQEMQIIINGRHLHKTIFILNTNNLEGEKAMKKVGLKVLLTRAESEDYDRTYYVKFTNKKDIKHIRNEPDSSSITWDTINSIMRTQKTTIR
ncbi:MAG: hypothetical protein GY928_29570 [Colwellia sp.]|nr:hypothetical protein [Colwellia sp.]